MATKPVGETEGILIYPVKDEEGDVGFYWRIQPPKSIRGEYKVDSTDHVMAYTVGELIDKIVDMAWKRREGED